MKNMKKTPAILLISICIVAVIICVIVTIVLNNDSRELEKESEKLNTLVAETSDGERIETEYTRIDNDKFFFKVPVNFVRWDDETIMKKYSGNVPDIVFSNEETTVNLILSFTEDIIANDQIEVYKNSAEITFTEIGEIIESDCYEVDGHNVGRIKVITPAADTDIYNDVIFFSYDDELIVLSFNCISELSEKWRSVGDFLIDSLFFTDNEQE